MQKKLKPPSTHLYAELIRNPELKNDLRICDLLEDLGRAHTEQISKYQAFVLPRTQDDSPEGKVTMQIHSGDPSQVSWTIRGILEQWEEAVVPSC